MCKLAASFLLLFFCVFAVKSLAQNVSVVAIDHVGTITAGENNADNPCITPQQYALIEMQCAENLALLGISNTTQPVAATTLLNWPLKSATGFTDCSYYHISAYVDQNTSTGAITDYNCGTKTYDGHRGTDIAISPFPFYKMDNNQVEVVAAAAGVILDKADGNFDKNCGANSLPANYVIIQHADGSRALYWHMKKNSVTTKPVGQSVIAGEYLGVVGSSGSSSGPHLHFEIWNGSTVSTRIDPYFGACNSLNPSSWWVSQKPYTEPSISKISVNTTDIVVPGCPDTETLNESSCFTIPFQGPGLPPGMAKFYIFMRNETSGMTANMSILNPDGTTFNNWTYTSTNTYNSSWRSWTKTLPTISGTYTFQATYNGITCAKTFDINNPAITAGGPTTFCQGGSVALTASAGNTFLWNTGATTQSITVSNSGSYTVTVTAAAGCSAVSPATTVTVNSAPGASITAGGATTFCQGGSVSLTASAGSAYLWNTGATTQSITVSSSGSYAVTVTGANGCTAVSAATVVTVNPLPTAAITPGGATTFCQGGSVSLTASAASSYLWNTGATTQSITVSNSGSYTVTVTGANGCMAVSAATVVTVNPMPTAAITPGGATTFCQGGSVSLTTSAASSYLWNTGATTQSITVSNSGSYAVTVTGANGCTAVSAATVVTVNPMPTAAITPGGATTFCQGGSVSLTTSAASSYLWSTGATTQSITVSNSGSYTVTVTGANGCMAISQPTAVTVNPLPAASVTAGGPTTFCQGGSVTLTASTGSAYQWSTGATTQSITVPNSGSYAVTVTSAAGCTAASSPTAVMVNLLPTASITAGGTTTFCEGGSVTLTASAASSYLWNTGATIQSITVSSSGSYTVTVTGDAGCTASSIATAVTVPPLPVAPTITANGTTLTSSSPTGNQWYLNGNMIADATAQTYAATQDGEYTVLVTDVNGCTAVSAVFNFMNTGIETIPENYSIAIFPNPNQGIFTIEIADGNGRIAAEAIEIYNLLGHKIWVSGARSPLRDIDISGQPGGIYIVSISSAKGKQVVKVVKE